MIQQRLPMRGARRQRILGLDKQKKGKATLDAALNDRLAEQGGVISKACLTAGGSSYGRSDL